MTSVYFFLPATLFLFSVSFATSTKTKCANIAAGILQTHISPVFFVNGGGELEPTSSVGTKTSSSKTASKIQFVQRFEKHPSHIREYTLGKKEGRITGGTAKVTCWPKEGNETTCTDTVSLDEDCNLEKYIVEDRGLIRYDRQMCLNVLKAFVDSKIPYETLYDGKDNKAQTDLLNTFVQLSKQREATLKAETDKDLHFTQGLTNVGWVGVCSDQLNKEAELDGKFNLIMTRTTEWFHEVHRNVSQSISSAAKSLNDVKRGVGKK